MESASPFLSPLAVDKSELPSLRQSSSPPLDQSIEAVEAESEEEVTSEDVENHRQGHGDLDVHLLLGSLFGQRVSSRVFSNTIQLLTDECTREYIDAFLEGEFECISKTISAFQHETRSKFVLDDR